MASLNLLQSSKVTLLSQSNIHGALAGPVEASGTMHWLERHSIASSWSEYGPCIENEVRGLDCILK